MTIIAFWFILTVSTTIFYHRYFSHNSFETSRALQFIGATLGTLALQGGPLWWASHHIKHHKYSDRDGDPHSPNIGVMRSVATWFLVEENKKTKTQYVRKWMKYPELLWLNRYWYIPPIIALLVFGLPYLIGAILAFFSMTMLASVSHIYGTQDHDTGDMSRNNFPVALITMGEGWHNNHHWKPWAANHGHAWWQVDTSYYVIRAFKHLNLVWNVKTFNK